MACLAGAPLVSAQGKTVAPTKGQNMDKPIPGSHGWANFTTADRDRLKLTDQQFTELRDMDEKYTPEYNALGLEPWTNEKFPALNAKRDRTIQDIMTPEQYKQWSTPSGAAPVVPPTIIPADN